MSNFAYGGYSANAPYGGAGYGGCGCGYPSPSYPVGGFGNGFALIVVLFILLIIVGAAFVC